MTLNGLGYTMATSEWGIERPKTRFEVSVTPPQQASSLKLSDLANGLPGITPRFGEVLGDAAAVCLENQGHSAGVVLEVNGAVSARYTLFWAGLTAQAQRTWADLQEATEFGAYGVAFLIIVDLTDYTVIERSIKGTGFDYWLGKKDGEPLFQSKARLEVSGILRGTEADIRARQHRKVSQTVASQGTRLPAYVVVVEFGTPLSRVVRA